MRTSRLILPAALVLLALSACGGGGGDPTPEPTITSTPEGGPTETPEPDPSTVAARIHVATNNVLVFAADDSQLADFTMYDPAGEVVAELTEVFGTDPAVSDSAGGLETAPSRTYDWSGFSIIDYEGLTIMNTDFIVSVSTAAVGDIQVVHLLRPASRQPDGGRLRGGRLRHRIPGLHGDRLDPGRRARASASPGSPGWRSTSASPDPVARSRPSPPRRPTGASE